MTRWATDGQCQAFCRRWAVYLRPNGGADPASAEDPIARRSDRHPLTGCFGAMCSAPCLGCADATQFGPSVARNDDGSAVHVALASCRRTGRCNCAPAGDRRNDLALNLRTNHQSTGLPFCNSGPSAPAAWWAAFTREERQCGTSAAVAEAIGALSMPFTC